LYFLVILKFHHHSIFNIAYFYCRSITIPEVDINDSVSLISGSNLDHSVITLDKIGKNVNELNDSEISEHKQSSTNEIEVDNHLGITELASKRSVLMKGISSNVSLPSANILRKSRHKNNKVVLFDNNNNPNDIIGEQESKKDDLGSLNFYKFAFMNSIKYINVCIRSLF
jgi:hypothetical protein